ncbi:MAG: hypothetical protein ACO1QB_10860, partial [Verrucomicrobiales bacterium]
MTASSTLSLNRFLILFIYSLLGQYVPVSNAASPLIDWRWSNPLPHGNHVYDLFYDGEDVLQVGDRGQAYLSSDLENWMELDTGSTKSLRSITYLAGKGIITGADGSVFFGTSLNDLTPISLPTADWLEGVAASSTIAVAVGDNGAIYSSPDGQNWTRRGNYSEWFRSVAYSGSLFVAVGEGGKMVQSADGINWDEKTLPTTADLNKVGWIGERFWVVGDEGTVLNSGLRGSWNVLPSFTTNHLYAVAGNGSDIVVAGDGVVFLNRNGLGVWTSQTASLLQFPAPIWPYYSAVWDGRLFLLGGRSGMLVEGFTSNNGPYGWVTRNDSVRNWLWSLDSNGSFYIASGNEGVIMTSSDGVAWDREVTPPSVSNETLLGVRVTTNAAVAVGTKGTVLISPNSFTNVISVLPDGSRITNLVSLLGVLWTEATRPTAFDLQGVAVNQTQVVVTGAKGSIYTSRTGSNWTQRASGTQHYLSSVVQHPGGYVAVGDFGTILSSPDAITWTSRGPGGNNWIYSVRHLNGGLIAVGQGGVIYTSDNGINWTLRTSGTTKWLNDVAYLDGTYYAVGTDGLVLTSTDKVAWTVRDSITSKSLYGLAEKGGQLVAVG